MIEKIFTYDLTNQTITDQSLRAMFGEKASVQYKLGQILVNFLNYDFSIYNKYREKANKVFQKINYDFNYDSEKVSVAKYFPNLDSTYYELAHGDAVDAMAFYLLDSISSIPYFHDFSFLSYEQFKNEEDFDFKSLQNHLTPIFTNCLDYDHLPDQTSLQKYMNFYDYSYFMNGRSFIEKTVFRHIYSDEEQLDYEIKTYANSVEFNLEAPPEPHKTKFDLIKENPEWKNRKIEIIHGYTFETPEEALQCEFLKMLELGIKIRKCAVCNKYFIVTGHNGKCCDDLYKDTGLTCQQVFADRNYKNKRKQNPILKEYDKAYKRMYARYSNKKNLASDEYTKWKNEATQERDKALKAYAENPSDTVINNFKQFLHNK